MSRFATALLATLFALPVAHAAETYTMDVRHTQVVVSYVHFGLSRQSVQLRPASGTIEYDATDPANSSVTVSIPLSSIASGVPELDTHLRAADILDAERFPTIEFRSTKVEKTGADSLSVTGDLTLHGVTKSATLAVTLLKAGEHPFKKVPALGFDATTTIRRSEFGVDKAIPAVSDALEVRIAVEAAAPKR